MPTPLRIATFNLENLDEPKKPSDPSVAERIRVLRPQLERLRADVLCLQEVHGQKPAGQPRRLAVLTQLLAGTRYAGFQVESTLTSNNEPFEVRNVVIVSRLPVLSRQQLKHDLIPAPVYKKVTAQPAEAAQEVSWERPLLRVVLDLAGGRRLHVINGHLKSKLPTDVAGQKKDQFTWKSVPGWAEGYFLSSMKRVGQALELRMLIDQIFDQDQNALIASCGDFNADLDDVPLLAIRGLVEDTGNPALHQRVMVPCENNVPEPARFSLYHHGKGQMLDHVLCSRPLLAWFRHTEIHNEVLPDESGAFRTDVKFPESDHAPVVAEFEIP